jgi:hypothetical protein
MDGFQGTSFLHRLQTGPLFLTAIIFALLHTSVVQGQEEQFGPQQVIFQAARYTVGSALAVDLDDDVDLDVLFAANNRIGWYENLDGLGAFGPQHLISIEVSEVRAIYAADLDGDGDPDVLSASSGDDKIAWYENLDGQGTFGTQRIIDREDEPSSVAAADFDGDGDLDVVAAFAKGQHEWEIQLAWYENVGMHGIFDGSQVVSEGDGWWSLGWEGVSAVHIADLDGDNDQDVLCASSSGIAWFANDGEGEFYLQIPLSGAGDSVSAGDLDGDGDVDVLSASSGNEDYSGRIAWHENLPVPEEPWRYFEERSVSETGAASIHAADLDGDADLDVLSNVGWYENEDGQGTFSTQRVISTQALVSATAADIDGDDDLDVLATMGRENKIVWFENSSGQATFSEEHIIAAGEGFVSPWFESIDAADLDGDGDLDVLSASPNANQIAWHENTNPLGFVSSQQIISTEAGGVTSVSAADLDGDGDSDVLSASSDDGEIAWYPNTDGQGTFGQQQIISASASMARSSSATDLDGDGDLDVLAVSAQDSITWLENADGQGTFNQKHTVHAGGAEWVEAIHVADLDGDGDPDVLSAAPYTGETTIGKIAWYENLDGQGTFGPQQVISTDLEEAQSVHAADLDGDGDLDVLSASWADDKLAWYENTDGAGCFGPQQILSTEAAGVRSVVAADLDGDDDQDVLSASWADHTIAWYENLDGRATFGPLQVISTEAFYAWAVYAADVRGNDQPDVLSISLVDEDHTLGLIAWYENLMPTPSPVEPEPQGVPVAIRLEPNYPNPFNPATTLRFALPRPATARLDVFDATGRHVACLVEGVLAAGRHEVGFDAHGLPSGVYFYRLHVGTFKQTRAMLHLK